MNINDLQLVINILLQYEKDIQEKEHTEYVKNQLIDIDYALTMLNQVKDDVESGEDLHLNIIKETFNRVTAHTQMMLAENAKENKNIH